MGKLQTRLSRNIILRENWVCAISPYHRRCVCVCVCVCVCTLCVCQLSASQLVLNSFFLRQLFANFTSIVQCTPDVAYRLNFKRVHLLEDIMCTNQQILQVSKPCQDLKLIELQMCILKNTYMYIVHTSLRVELYIH